VDHHARMGQMAALGARVRIIQRGVETVGPTFFRLLVSFQWSIRGDAMMAAEGGESIMGEEGDGRRREQA